MEMIVAFAIGIMVLSLVLKLISLPFRFIKWVITNSLVGCVMLFAISLLGFDVEINIIKALIAGVFGIPGVILVLLI